MSILIVCVASRLFPLPVSQTTSTVTSVLYDETLTHLYHSSFVVQLGTLQEKITSGPTLLDVTLDIGLFVLPNREYSIYPGG